MADAGDRGSLANVLLDRGTGAADRAGRALAGYVDAPSHYARARSGAERAPGCGCTTGDDMAARFTVTDHLLARLSELGVDAVFGVPATSP